MGKKLGPQAPPPLDIDKIGATQAANNTNAAVDNTILGNIDTNYGNLGSSTFEWGDRGFGRDVPTVQNVKYAGWLEDLFKKTAGSQTQQLGLQDVIGRSLMGLPQANQQFTDYRKSLFDKYGNTDASNWTPEEVARVKELKGSVLGTEGMTNAEANKYIQDLNTAGSSAGSLSSLFQQQIGAGQDASDWARKYINSWDDPNNARDNLVNYQTGIIEDARKRHEGNFDSKLANMGHDPSTGDAYYKDLYGFNKPYVDAIEGVAANAPFLSEQLTNARVGNYLPMAQQGANSLSTLLGQYAGLGGGQNIPVPSPSPYSAGAVAPVDYTNLALADNQNQWQHYNSQLAQQSARKGGLTNLVTAFV